MQLVCWISFIRMDSGGIGIPHGGFSVGHSWRGKSVVPSRRPLCQQYRGSGFGSRCIGCTTRHPIRQMLDNIPYSEKWGKWRGKAIHPQHEKGGMCFVSAMPRIVRRFARIRGAHDLVTPLAMYKGSPTGDAPSFVTSVQIEKMMRSLASKVYSLDPVNDLSLIHI